MDPATELAALRQEVATLRRQMNALHRFLTVEDDEETGEPRNLNLRCSFIMMQSPFAPGRTQMLLSTSEDGPAITLHDIQEKPRVVLAVDRNTPSVELLTAEHQQAVLLHAHPTEGLGLVSVFQNGQPRALIKAGPDSTGVISAVHNDGQSRIFLRSTEDSAMLMAVNPDLKTTVKLGSETALGGGQMVINAPNGKAALILSHMQGQGGVVLAHGADGHPTASLPNTGFEEKGGEK